LRRLGGWRGARAVRFQISTVIDRSLRAVFSRQSRPIFQCGGNAMVRFAAFNQSVTRFSTPKVLDQQAPAQPKYKPIYRLILVDGIVGPVEQGNVSGAFDAYTWTMNNEFTYPRTKATSVQTETNAVSAAPAFFSACSSGHASGESDTYSRSIHRLRLRLIF
jgi:hypothetical protein